MAIQSTKHSDEPRAVSPQMQSFDLASEFSLRPKNLNEYIGQSALKSHLQVAIDSAKIRKTPLEHILFYGPPGLWKTTIANIIASEMGSHLKSTSGPAIEKQSDIISLLTGLTEGDVLFIDEIHRLRPQIEEILYSAMEDFQIDIMIGTGTGATSIKMDIAKFTLVGATTKLSSLSHPLRDRFGNIMKLDFYSENELSEIIIRSFWLLGTENISKSALQAIASRSRWTPRIANRYVKIIRDYATTGHKIESKNDIESIFEKFGVDDFGLDILDKKLLRFLAEKGIDKTIGLTTLASLIGEEVATIEDVVEPYLLQIGFIERTPRWRQITQKWLDYMNAL